MVLDLIVGLEVCLVLIGARWEEGEMLRSGEVSEVSIFVALLGERGIRREVVLDLIVPSGPSVGEVGRC